MAGTFTPNTQVDPSTVFGNLRVCIGILDAADGAGEAIATSLDQIVGLNAPVPLSCATDGGVKWTFSGGNITPTSADSGDTFYAVIYGK